MEESPKGLERHEGELMMQERSLLGELTQKCCDRVQQCLPTFLATSGLEVTID